MYSQFNDELIIERCLQQTGVRWKRCCEFGARDGLDLSNTAWLLRDCGWSGTLIEPSVECVNLCRANYRGYPVVVLPDMVTTENINELVPAELDFLSIDVDGNDYWLWQALEHRPGLVCIEYNARITAGTEPRPYDPDFVRQEGDYFFGAPPDILKRLAAEKQYELLADDGHANLFFGAKERLHAQSV